MAAVERTAGAIRGRSDRICNVVASEMDNYEPGLYTERVLEAVRLLSTGMMPNFAQKTDGVVDLLGRGKEDEIDDNEFIEATRLVYDGVREIRHAVLLNRGLGDDDSDNEWANMEDRVGSDTASQPPTGRNSTTEGMQEPEWPEEYGIKTVRNYINLSRF